jgi:predicted nucleic acid-binding protein
MLYLLDTSALFILYRNEAGAERVAPLFENKDYDIWLCALSIAEFGRKLRETGLDAGETGALLDTYLPMFTGLVPIDDGVARSALRLIEQVPVRLPLVDSLIASAALTRGAILVHRDKHLAAIPEKILPQINLGLTPEKATA